MLKKAGYNPKDITPRNRKDFGVYAYKMITDVDFI